MRRSGTQAHECAVYGTNKSGDPRTQKLGSVWLEHPEARRYEGVTYDPSRGPEFDGMFNLSHGFAVEPQPGEAHAIWVEHVAENICGGDEAVFMYLHSLFAVLVQAPAVPWGVAVVLRGSQGTGKGSFAQPLLDIFGPHAHHVHRQEYLTGRFNGHLRSKSLLFVDEGYWSGGKKELGTLKGLITDPTITIEAKFKTPVEVPNRLHLIMASNEDWVIPAGAMERRFLALEVGENRRQDGVYFSRMRRAMRDGGTANLLHDLLDVDLSGFDPMLALPRTTELVTQRALSLDPIEEWWYELLLEGQVPEMTNQGVELVLIRSVWPPDQEIEVPRNLMQQDYHDWCRKRVQRPQSSAPTRIGTLLRRVLPGDYPVDCGGSANRRYRLPGLDDARTAWEAVQGGPWSW